MRELKFRMLTQTTGKILGYVDIYDLLRNGPDVLPDFEEAVLEGVKFEQYTSLKDKNGKEIYEGDIVRFEDAIFTIGWNDDHARFGFKPIKGCDISMSFSMKECEVIGNVHENKELLENEQK